MRSVLITGGTGFFGHAFVRRLLCRPIRENVMREEYGDCGPERICIYSRDEHKQAAMREKSSDDPRLRFFIGDVRDRTRLTRAMEGVDVVVHAAALKRIEVGAYNPSEMVKTNILGSMNVIEAATDARVERVVFLSSDKAYQPISPYGQSKALAESLFLAANNTRGANGPRFAVCRYGNVAGSTGSVIPRWRGIIESGKKVPITDPDCTRFFMRADEAVDLVLATIDTMPETVAIPDLPAFRLGDLAQAMVAWSITTGLPAWEKMHENMDADRCSATARRMSIDELREALKNV